MKQGEIDGVTCFWVEAEGPLTAGLVFGVGTADEPFTARGYSHLIEHLSLHGVARDLSYNGATEPTSTMMHCRGTVDQVRVFFEQVVGSLASLPFHELERECRVLTAEAEQRPNWLGATALNIIYGSRGPGITALPEIGLWNPTAERVDAWRQRNFVKSNAVAFFHGPAPAGISFAALADGPRPPQPPLPHRYVTAPSLLHMNLSGPALFATHARGIGALVCSNAGAARVNERLRNDRGISYSVGGGVVELDRDTQLLSISADASSEHTSEAFELMRAELCALAESGPTQEEVERYLDAQERSAAEPGHAMGELINRAKFHLHDRPFIPFDDALQQIRMMSSEQLVAPFRSAMDMALWLTPVGTRLPDARLEPIPHFSATTADGPDHESKFDERILRIDDTSLSVGDEHGMTTIRHGQIVGAARYDDGGWIFWGDDGFVAALQPSDFDAQDAVARFVERIPPEVVVARGRAFRTAAQQAALVPKERPKENLRAKLRSRLNAAGPDKQRSGAPAEDAPLTLPRPNVLLGHIGATAFAEAIVASDWAGAERIYAQQESEADRDHLVGVVSELGGTPTHVTPWVEGAVNPGLALLIRGEMGIGWAWHARTSARADRVSAEMFAEFHRRLRLAEKDLVESADRLPESPLPWVGLMTCGRGLQIPKTEQDDHYIAHVERGATLGGHATYQQFVCRKWFGSHNEMWEHAEWLLDQATPGATELGLVPMAFIEHHLTNDLSYEHPAELLSMLQKSDVITEAARKSYGDPAFPVHRIDSSGTLSTFFTYCWLTKQYDVAASLVPMIGDRFSEFPIGYFSRDSWLTLRNQVQKAAA